MTLSMVNKWSHYPGDLKHHTQLRCPYELSKWWTFGFYFMLTKMWLSITRSRLLMDTVGITDSKWLHSMSTDILDRVSVPAWTRVTESSILLDFLSFINTQYQFLAAVPLLNHRRLQWDVTTPRYRWRINGSSPQSRPDTDDILHQILLHLSWKGILIYPSHKNLRDKIVQIIGPDTCY